MRDPRPLALLAVAAFSCATQPLDFDGYPRDRGVVALTDGAAADLTGGGTPDLAFVTPIDLGGAGPGITGDPCTKSSDCQGTKAVCILKDALGHSWPGGYCSSFCNPVKNDPMTGVNHACPGNGICEGQTTQGQCFTYCDGQFGMTPCQRAGYSCFFGCEPTSLSECNPAMIGSCPQDGGVTLGNGSYSGRACERYGYDEVGVCVDGCSPFSQGCPDEMGMMAACYASYDSGEGMCLPIYQGGGDGAPCQYLGQCDPGLECYYAFNGQSNCRPFCGGPNKVQCTNGKKCAQLGAVSIAIVGACGG